MRAAKDAPDAQSDDILQTGQHASPLDAVVFAQLLYDHAANCIIIHDRKPSSWYHGDHDPLSDAPG